MEEDTWEVGEILSTIERITEIDFVGWIITAFLILAICIAMYEIISKALEIINKPIGIAKQRKEDHKLIQKNIQAIKKLEENHKRDNQISNEHDEDIKKELTSFINEMRIQIKNFSDDRIHDREQSINIQDELSNSIKSIIESNIIRDKQINSLIFAQREVLADKINEKYKHYISIKGIPEDEYDEFVSLHDAYKGVGGNHSGDEKYEYCINHLPVIPIETKLAK